MTQVRATFTAVYSIPDNPEELDEYYGTTDVAQAIKVDEETARKDPFDALSWLDDIEVTFERVQDELPLPHDRT